jgi:hypothetical protein
MFKGNIIVLSILLMTFASCESEFEKQVITGKSLTRIEMGLENVESKRSDLVKELKKCAHLSGNEELFNQKIKSYRFQIAQSKKQKQQLITRFP